MSGVAHAALLLLLILPVLPDLPLLSAQTRVTGRVVTADSTPVRGTRVVLHRIGREVQGPIDSTRSDARGRFSFVFRPDTRAFYLVSTRHSGIEYFSSPVPTNPQRPDSLIRIVVYDTSSTAPVVLEARHFVLTHPGEDGSRSVLDMIVLQNKGQLTRVAPDTLRPSWTARLPHGTVGLQVGESDLSAEAVSRRGDSLIVTSPLAPGEKQLTIQYLVPRNLDVVELPLDQPGLRVNVLAEEPGVRVLGPGIALADSQSIQGRAFRRWNGVLPRPGLVKVVLPAVGRTPKWLLAALVAGLGIALGGTGWFLLTRRGQAAALAGPDELLDRIAALDARYLGWESETPAEEWSSYQVERARLKTELETSLAAKGWTQ